MQLHIDIYIWCAFQIFVFFKLASNVVLQGQARALTKIVSYPEDRKGLKKLKSPNPEESADLPLVRASNLFRNDLENIIPFSLVALAASFVQVNANVFVLLLVVYAILRMTHAVCLIGGRQPLRTISYLAGQLCSLALIVLIIIRLIPIFQSY